ncbi:MAG TPA: hypothetical protein VGY54_01960 [Polyangiaceae bacterium]|nr:hypothetical protein [Polyangiaceae bacterium]
MTSNNLAAVAIVLTPFLLLGCLSNSYYIERNEVERLASVDPESRWQSVRAVQRIGGSDNPPEDDSLVAPPEASGGVYVSTVVVDSHHHHLHYPPRRPIVRAVAAPSNAAPAAVAKGIPAQKGNGDPDTAALIAAAVVVGTGTGLTLAGSEGARYDGWLAINPDEPLHLQLRDGGTRAIALSSLSPNDLKAADGAIIYEGEGERFPKLGRAPLHRTGFTLSSALHLGGIPQVDHSTATGVGGYLLLGGNIANMVTLGLGATADGGVDSRRSLLMATVAPEVEVFPIRYVGFYGAAGWAYRNTGLDGGTRADEGWLVRGGLLGELALTTRLALQARAGAALEVFPERAAVTWEGQVGLAVY